MERSHDQSVPLGAVGGSLAGPGGGVASSGGKRAAAESPPWGVSSTARACLLPSFARCVCVCGCLSYAFVLGIRFGFVGLGLGGLTSLASFLSISSQIAL